MPPKSGNPNNSSHLPVLSPERSRRLRDDQSQQTTSNANDPSHLPVLSPERSRRLRDDQSQQTASNANDPSQLLNEPYPGQYIRQIVPGASRFGNPEILRGNQSQRTTFNGQDLQNSKSHREQLLARLGVNDPSQLLNEPYPGQYIRQIVPGASSRFGNPEILRGNQSQRTTFNGQDLRRDQTASNALGLLASLYPFRRWK